MIVPYSRSSVKTDRAIAADEYGNWPANYAKLCLVGGGRCGRDNGLSLVKHMLILLIFRRESTLTPLPVERVSGA
jgi:hypothetical protein